MEYCFAYIYIYIYRYICIYANRELVIGSKEVQQCVVSGCQECCVKYVSAVFMVEGS